jgi:hypothetical protein
MIVNFQICKYLLSNDSWTDKWDNLSSTPYAIMQHRVIVYDNAKSLQAKVIFLIYFNISIQTLDIKKVYRS